MAGTPWTPAIVLDRTLEVSMQDIDQDQTLQALARSCDTLHAGSQTLTPTTFKIAVRMRQLYRALAPSRVCSSAGRTGVCVLQCVADGCGRGWLDFKDRTSKYSYEGLEGSIKAFYRQAKIASNTTEAGRQRKSPPIAVVAIILTPLS